MKTTPSSALTPSIAATALLQARVSDALAKQAKSQAEIRSESLSDFVRTAVENEVARRTQSRPERPISIADLDKRMRQMHDLLAKQEAETRQAVSLLMSISVAIGIPDHLSS